MTKLSLRSSSWTRPQQLAVTVYGIWSAFWTLVVGFVLLSPDRFVRPAGIAGVLVPVAICLLIALFSYRRSNRAFWPAMIFFTFTGLGAIWVPLRPAAHVGEDTLTLIVHAFVDDLPGLFVGAWLIIGLIRFRHAWAQQPVGPQRVRWRCRRRKIDLRSGSEADQQHRLLYPARVGLREPPLADPEVTMTTRAAHGAGMGENVHLDLDVTDFPRTQGALRTEPAVHPDAVVVTASGEFDLSNCDQLRDHLVAAMAEPPPFLVLDLSAVGFIDSVVLNTLLIVDRQAEQVRTSFRLAAPSPTVAKVLYLTSLDTVLAIYPDLDAALEV